MHKIVPAERQDRSKGTITKSRCKPSKNGLQRSFLAPPARLELTTFRLGGGPSILVRYGGIYRNYSIFQGSGIRTVRLLGGVCSILLSYWRRNTGRQLCRSVLLFYPLPFTLSTKTCPFLIHLPGFDRQKPPSAIIGRWGRYFRAHRFTTAGAGLTGSSGSGSLPAGIPF